MQGQHHTLQEGSHATPQHPHARPHWDIMHTAWTQWAQNCGVVLLSTTAHLSASVRACRICLLAAYVEELRQRERELGIEPDLEVDALLKAEAVEGKRSNIVTDLMLRVLGLEVGRVQSCCGLLLV